MDIKEQKLIKVPVCKVNLLLEYHIMAQALCKVIFPLIFM